MRPTAQAKQFCTEFSGLIRGPSGHQSAHSALLDVQTRVLGPAHPDTLRTRNNFANLLSDVGDHDAAAAEHRVILEIRTALMGPDHVDTLISRINLTAETQRLDLDAAATEYTAILEVLSRTQGPVSRTALVTRNNLARVLALQGDFTTAMSEAHKVLQVRLGTLGENHPDTATSRRTLAQIEEWRKQQGQ